ncbi:MAG: DUF3971 domain-containing protein [Alphaproteobacteria bacterium]|nr:DUF3971 domain-containing protein [Alphaproteobacteria bacterium]
MKPFFNSILGVFLGICTFIVMFFCMAAVLIIWKVHSSPIDTNAFAPYAKIAIENFVPNSSVSIESSSLNWDNNSHAFILTAENIIIANDEGYIIASFPSVSAQLKLLNLLFGQFLPSRITLDSPHIRIPYSDDPSVPVADDNGSDLCVSGVRSKITDALSELSAIRDIKISNGVIDIYDPLSLKNWEINVVSAMFSRRSKRLLPIDTIEGKIKLAGSKKDFSLDIAYNFDPFYRTHFVSAAFDSVTPYSILDNTPLADRFHQASNIKVPFSGSIDLVFDSELYLNAAAMDIKGSKGELVFEEIWKNNRPIEKFLLTLKYNKNSKEPVVSNAVIDFGEAVVSAKTELVFSSGFLDISRKINNAKNTASFSSVIELPMVLANDLEFVWSHALGANARDWIITNMNSGVFENGKAHITGKLDFDNFENSTIEKLDASVNAGKMNVNYMDNMPHAENVSAEAVFDINKAVIKITSGNVFNINIVPFTLEITGLSEEEQDIFIPLKISGSVSDVLRLLDSPPLGYAARMGIKPEDIMGNIEGTASFGFPLLKALSIDDVDISAEAGLRNVYTRDLIEGIVISEGNLSLDLTKGWLSVEGGVLLSGSPFQIAMRENFEGRPLRTVSGTGTVRGNDWQKLGVDVLEGSRENSQINFDITQSDKSSASAKVKIDMTAAEISVPLLNWQKAMNAPAVLSLNVGMEEGKPVEISDISLQGGNLSVSGNITLSPDMKNVAALDFPKFVLGRNNAQISYANGTSNAIPMINISGQALDISGFMNSDTDDAAKKEKKEESSFTGHLKIKLARLYTDTDTFLENIEGHAIKDSVGWREINLRMFAAAHMPLEITLLPIAFGARELLISTNDFGAALKGLGFTKTISGGRLLLSGKSTALNPHDIKGSIKIEDFTVNNMPLLGVLLNAISPFGFAGLFTNSAQFSSLIGDFNWNGDTIELSRVRASTAAFSINTEGTVLLNDNTVNLRGNVVPFSVMNSLINRLPIVGNLLTGGRHGGILAVSYNITGDLSDPQVSVNPMSVLAPGIIRSILFEGGMSQ